VGTTASAAAGERRAARDADAAVALSGGTQIALVGEPREDAPAPLDVDGDMGGPQHPCCFGRARWFLQPISAALDVRPISGCAYACARASASRRWVRKRAPAAGRTVHPHGM